MNSILDSSFSASHLILFFLVGSSFVVLLIDFATVVDSQGDAIQQLSWQSIEAFGHAQSGLEHLVKTVKTTKKRKENVFSLLVSGMVVLAFCYVAAGIIASDFGIGGGASSFDGGEGHAEEGSPKFLIPINMIATP